MGFNGVQINKLNGQLGTTAPSTDNVNLLLVVVPAADLPVGVTHWNGVKCISIDDVSALGFNAAFDANEDVLYYQQSECYFRYAPNAPLYIMAVPDSLTAQAIFENANLRTFIKSHSEIKGIGLIGNTETFLTIDQYIPAIQAVIDGWASEQMRIDYVILEGRGTVAATTISDFTDKRALNAPNISVSIAQDPAVASLDAAYAKYADVGSVLGMLAQRKVNENLGSVDIVNKPSQRSASQDYSLTYGGKYANAALSDGQLISTFTDTQLKTLTAKGYIFAADYNDYPGFFFNSSPTCAAITSDYNYIENNRTWNKAARIIRGVLLPVVKATIPKNEAGYISATTIANWTNRVQKAIEKQMIETEECSGFSFTISPNQFPDENTPLVCNASVQKDGIVHEFVVNVGLTNSI